MAPQGPVSLLQTQLLLRLLKIGLTYVAGFTIPLLNAILSLGETVATFSIWPRLGSLRPPGEPVEVHAFVVIGETFPPPFSSFTNPAFVFLPPRGNLETRTQLGKLRTPLTALGYSCW